MCRVGGPILLTSSFTRAGIHSEDSLTRYGCCFNWSRSTFGLHLQRKYLYYVIHLIVPYSLFSLIAVLAFILQPSRPERLTLGMVRKCKHINYIFIIPVYV